MTHPETKRIDVVTTYLLTGNLALTAKTCDVPLATVKEWRKQPWWLDIVTQLQAEGDQELDAKLAKRVDRALDIVNDRLENGDWQYDPKTGQFVRKPVSIKDGWKVANEMIDKRWLLRKLPNEQVDQAAVSDILRNLAKEFAEMAKSRLKSSKEEKDEQTS